MNVTDSDDNESLEQLPAELLAALRDGEPLKVSSAEDERVLAKAHEVLDGRIEKIARPDFGYGRWLAIAAAVALCLVLLRSAKENSPDETTPVVTRQPTDLNGDATVDILDAMLFARRIEAGEDIPDSLDLNRDGATDRRDLDLLTSSLVKLDDKI